MKLFSIFMLVFTLGGFASGYSQKQVVTLNLKQSATPCGRFLPAGCRAAATWRSGVRRPCATGASTLRWGVSDGC